MQEVNVKLTLSIYFIYLGPEKIVLTNLKKPKQTYYEKNY